MGIQGPRVLSARARLQGYFVWDILDFIINAILFVLMGCSCGRSWTGCRDTRRAPSMVTPSRWPGWS